MIFLKKYKKTIAFSLAFFIISQMFFYFVTTKNAYDGNIYFNSQSAVKNWGLKSDKILFEFSDENFYVAFDNNKNIKSSRKDFGFWVRNKFDSFFENSSNEIYISTIKNIVYIWYHK